MASGSFTAPDHEFPSYLELELVATDQDGLTHSVVRRLDPLTVDLTFATQPVGPAADRRIDRPARLRSRVR